MDTVVGAVFYCFLKKSFNLNDNDGKYLGQTLYTNSSYVGLIKCIWLKKVVS